MQLLHLTYEGYLIQALRPFYGRETNFPYEALNTARFSFIVLQHRYVMMPDIFSAK